MAHEPLEYHTLDVFTEDKFAGNPLAVVLLPHGNETSQETKQLIAREFNYSETVFLHLPSPETDAPEYRYDIFTTNKELPFAGHPTIGTATHVHAATGRRSFTLHCKAGPVSVAIDASGRANAAITPNVRVHKARVTAEMLQQHQPDLTLPKNTDYPIVSFVQGMTFVLVRLWSEEELGKVRTSTVDLLPLVDLDEDFPSPELMAYFYYVGREEVVLEGGAREWKISTRMILKQLEDPATGSAACTLSSYLAMEAVGRSSTGGTSVREFEITQGVEMGRRSDIGVEVTCDGRGTATKAVLKGLRLRVVDVTADGRHDAFTRVKLWEGYRGKGYQTG